MRMADRGAGEEQVRPHPDLWNDPTGAEGHQFSSPTLQAKGLNRSRRCGRRIATTSTVLFELRGQRRTTPTQQRGGHKEPRDPCAPTSARWRVTHR
ncbi:hypothetical protein, partial [Nonomuraea dietziae]|uniref:hypothetical protein n=1 Tax=Nonomuraea dietziae TaxID=65515 RepID=UPI0031CFDCEC